VGLENLADVSVFVQVVESRGLSAASRVLSIPPNTVSRTVTRLEESLGVRLMVRTTRAMQLTEEGRLFYERAVELLELARRAEEALGGAGDEISGLVRVAVRTTTVQFSFVPDLLALLEQHPRLEMQLQVVDDDLDLVALGLDLAVRVGTQPDSSLRMRSVGQVTFVLAATRDYLDRAGRPDTPEALGTHECIRQQVGPRSAWNLRGPRGRQVSVMVGGRFGCPDVRTQREAIYSGFGIGLRPIGEVLRAERAGELERVLPRWSLEPLPVYVLQPPRRPSPHRARPIELVIQLIERAIGRMGAEPLITP
jgi:DNA-binding transcriptional LysR family regulator